MSIIISNTELVDEIRDRLRFSEQAIREQHILTEELSSVNRKLVASEKMKSDFLSNIRNEINNPLTAVLELSKSMRDDNMDIASMKRSAGLIQSEIFNLNFQLRNIFISAEIEAGESSLAVCAVSINRIVQEVADAYAELIAKKKLVLHIDAVTDERLFYTDPEKLHLVLSNIVANAVHYNREEGTISIRWRIENEVLLLTVSDTGPGINEKDLPKIFDRFVQLESGHSKAYSGHGLGLSLTKSLVETMGGTISAESREGEGSIFTICLKEAAHAGEGSTDFSANGNDVFFTDNIKF